VSAPGQSPVATMVVGSSPRYTKCMRDGGTASANDLYWQQEDAVGTCYAFHPECFRGLRPDELELLDRYFFIKRDIDVEDQAVYAASLREADPTVQRKVELALRKVFDRVGLDQRRIQELLPENGHDDTGSSPIMNPKQARDAATQLMANDPPGTEIFLTSEGVASNPHPHPSPNNPYPKQHLDGWHARKLANGQVVVKKNKVDLRSDFWTILRRSWHRAMKWWGMR
jgi:hypothetical protein